jgi:hypothetical protein
METSALQPDRAPAGAADDLVAEVNRMFDEAKARVAAASGTTPSVPRATAAAMTRALLYHHDPTRYRLTEPARSIAGLRPHELARCALESAGVRTGGLSRIELAGLALGRGTRASPGAAPARRNARTLVSLPFALAQGNDRLAGMSGRVARGGATLGERRYGRRAVRLDGVTLGGGDRRQPQRGVLLVAKQPRVASDPCPEK